MQTTERVWSPYQQKIFEAIETQTNSLSVEAVAGSGKTTTIVEAISHVPSDQSVVFLAFNKSIAEELKRRVKEPNAKCMTLHSAGFNAWRQYLAWDAGDLKVNSRKCSEIVKEILDERGSYKKFGPTLKLVSIAKASGIVPLGTPYPVDPPTKHEQLEMWWDLVDFYGIDEEEVDIELAEEVLRKSILKSREEIDYDDMLYMPIIAGASFEKYDVIFLDEAQDVSEIQVEMVSRMRFAHSRVIAVGDRNQAIYGFRGALSDSLDQIAKRFNAESLPLSVSYRCPQSVVKHVQQWVEHIEWHESAPEGLQEYNYEWKVKDFQVGDAILCRVSQPTVELAFLLIRNKIPARVLGRDIGAGLIKLVDKMKASDMVDLDQKLLKYYTRESSRPKADESKLATLNDKIATLRVFMDELGPDGALPDLTNSINQLFGEAQDSSHIVTLSTVHKSKGLEFDRVFILDADKHMPSPWAREPWQKTQEKNLMYVAATRAKRELRYISSEGLL